MISALDGYLESLEYIMCDHFDIVPTGVLREMFEMVTDADYKHFAQEKMHPTFGDDMFLNAEETLRSHYAFFEFLMRMTREFGSYGNFCHFDPNIDDDSNSIDHEDDLKDA